MGALAANAEGAYVLAPAVVVGALVLVLVRACTRKKPAAHALPSLTEALTRLEQLKDAVDRLEQLTTAVERLEQLNLAVQRLDARLCSLRDALNVETFYVAPQGRKIHSAALCDKLRASEVLELSVSFKASFEDVLERAGVFCVRCRPLLR